MNPAPLLFLKLGGSLLGDKRKPRSFRAGAVARVGREIRRVLKQQKRLRLLIGHGGGGAAHCPAQRFRTRKGLPGGGGWRGFAETRNGVMAMNRRVLKALAAAGVHPVLVPPVAGVIARNGKIQDWDLTVIKAVLAAGQIPLIHGDVALDRAIGFTICSTEELFAFLAPRLRPQRIVLASDVEGVYVDGAESLPGVKCRPLRKGVAVAETVNRRNVGTIRRRLRRRRAPSKRKPAWDVTGGMLAKIEQLLAITRRGEVAACIVSGLRPGAVQDALLGKEVGTRVG